MPLRRIDDRRPIMVGDVLEAKRNTMARQDVPDCDAEGGPRKLDEGEHGTYMKEARGKPQAANSMSQQLQVFLEFDVSELGVII